MSEETKKELGQYYTVKNPFNHKLFYEWLEYLTPDMIFIEPFAGANNIVRLIQEIGVDNSWKCFDIEPSVNNVTPEYHIEKLDTIKNFPKGYNVAITNPPYLAKNSASRMGLPYPDTEYDDLYKLCLNIMLEHCDYVAAIIPESFVTSGLFINRLFGIISINECIFDDTDCPVCLALFTPSKAVKYYVGKDYIGNITTLKKFNLEEYLTGEIKWVFNDPNGKIGVKCVDNQIGDNIYFHHGEDIPSEDIKVSSRSFTRIGGLSNEIDVDEFIRQCNIILNEYRDKTHDVFLTSFKGLRKDGKYRRRIDFKTLRCIMNKSYMLLTNKESE